MVWDRAGDDASAQNASKSVAGACGGTGLTALGPQIGVSGVQRAWSVRTRIPVVMGCFLRLVFQHRDGSLPNGVARMARTGPLGKRVPGPAVGIGPLMR